jgi:hypothetical protein
MKKIILSIIGVLAVLWVALFVSGQQVLVWEERKGSSISHDPPHTFEEIFEDEGWNCTYFNGRRFITKVFPFSRTACPNFRKNR